MSTANYAYIKNGTVVNVAIFEEPVNPELLSFFKNEFLLDDIILANEKTIINGTFDGSKFWTIPPYPSWIKNEETNEWIAPVPKPSDENKSYIWDENTCQWQEITE